MRFASFTARDEIEVPEELPEVCPDCEGLLEGGWQVEELVYGPRDTEVVWFTKCPCCDGLVTKEC